jgi:phosphatidylinositol alpha-1,6-mannosyltransferase
MKPPTLDTAHVKQRLLLSAQTFVPGNGGICAVARMTARVLLQHYPLEALAWQDVDDHRIETVPVRVFRNRRILFALTNLAASQRATHVLYDHVGTARAHFDLPFRRRPYAVWVHGWELWHEPLPKHLRAIAGAALVLANSAYTVKRASTVLPAGVVSCPLGTPESRPPPTIGPSAAPPTVMLLGRADELFAKGHDILIDIWPDVISAVPDARLLLVGGGNALDRVRELAAASRAREAIEITGFVPDEALDSYWRRATVFAMLGFAEGFGLVYAQAMRRGLPVVASTEDAGQEINVEGWTGFNVSRDDKKRLTEVLVALLRDPDYARTLGSRAHSRWQEQYTFEAFGRRFTEATARFLLA